MLLPESGRDVCRLGVSDLAGEFFPPPTDVGFALFGGSALAGRLQLLVEGCQSALRGNRLLLHPLEQTVHRLRHGVPVQLPIEIVHGLPEGPAKILEHGHFPSAT